MTVIWQFTGIWNEYLYGVTFSTGEHQPITAALISFSAHLSDAPHYCQQRAAVLLHRAADEDMEGWQNTSAVPEAVDENVRGYVEIARGFQPPDARYLTNHRGHFVFVKPEEQRFVTAELIRRTTFTATEQELKQRVAALREAGWNQLVIPITVGEEMEAQPV